MPRNRSTTNRYSVKLTIIVHNRYAELARKEASMCHDATRKGELLKNGQDAYGNVVKIKVVKNKVAPPFRTATVNMLYGEGITHVDEIINLAVENDIIDKAGAWFSYKGEKIGQGFAAVREYLKNHPEVDEEVTAALKEKLFPKPETAETE